MVSSSNRPGRRPGPSATREAILAAARAAFTAHGYDGATIRAVAAAAGVDPALVLHYFGSKRGLFAEAAALPFDPATAIPAIIAGDPATAAERLLRFFLAAWDSGQSRDGLLALLRAAVNDEQAAAMFRARFAGELLGRVAAQLPGPGVEVRVGLVGSTLAGLVFARYIVRLEPLASLPAEGVVAMVAPTIQRYLTGPLELPGAPGEGGSHAPGD
ncbi:MAG: TetR family transcriptional regulator [Dehalococcoidia bacterium]|nr:TetR family transcriptional regulator [Dehalococcoidia bacterium]